MSTFISRGSGREGDLLLAALNQSFQEQGGTFQVLCCVRVSRCPLAVVVERKGESFRVIRVRVVEVAAELDGAIMVIVVVGVGAYQLGEIEARRRTIRFPEFVPVAFSCLAVLDVWASLPVPVCLPAMEVRAWSFGLRARGRFRQNKNNESRRRYTSRDA